MLYLALSCLQGRRMADAFAALCALEPDGIQLTPGNLPTPGFALEVVRSGRAVRTHHGFSYRRRKRPAVWVDGALVARSDSVHPPREPTPAGWLEAFAARPDRPVLEVMYPGYALGDGPSVERAMDLGLALAVDVSHVHIQRVQGVMSSRTWDRLQAYDQVAEVHVSANDGTADTHRPLDPRSFGLDWARHRGDVPVVLECYLHRLSRAQRAEQVEFARPATVG